MVAYSFKARFADLIRGGQKCQTIRAHRRRHAHEGERVQLFTGLRTRAAQKIIPDPVCVRVEPCWIFIDATGITQICLDMVPVRDLDAFARWDGFADLADMSAFWLEHNRRGNFDGMLIAWAPPT